MPASIPTGRKLYLLSDHVVARVFFSVHPVGRGFLAQPGDHYERVVRYDTTSVISCN